MQIVFYGMSNLVLLGKYILIMLSAELAQRVVNVKHNFFFFFYFGLIFMIFFFLQNVGFYVSS